MHVQVLVRMLCARDKCVQVCTSACTNLINLFNDENQFAPQLKDVG